MSFSITGINYRRAGIRLRECVACTAEELPAALHSLAELPGLDECVLLSTCNRTELYHADTAPSDALLRWLERRGAIATGSLQRAAYHHRDDDAMLHGMRVASGIDSMVLGEAQILGQMKQAVAQARQHGLVGPVLEPIFQQLFHVAKRVRTETSIGRHPVSLPSVIAALVAQIFAEPGRLQLLVAGVGDIVRSVLRHFGDSGVGGITIANRSRDTAAELVRSLAADYLPLAELTPALGRSDVVICGVSSSVPLLSREDVERAGTRPPQRPLLIVDLAVPRNVDPAVHTLDNVYLYSLDDLRQRLEESRRRRAAELPEAEALLETERGGYRSVERQRAAGALIATYRQQAEQLRDAALERARRELHNGTDPRPVLERLARDLTRKLTHAPSAHIRRVFASREGVDLETARAEFLQLLQGVRCAAPAPPETMSGDPVDPDHPAVDSPEDPL